MIRDLIIFVCKAIIIVALILWLLTDPQSILDVGKNILILCLTLAAASIFFTILQRSINWLFTIPRRKQTKTDVPCKQGKEVLTVRWSAAVRFVINWTDDGADTVGRHRDILYQSHLKNAMPGELLITKGIPMGKPLLTLSIRDIMHAYFMKYLYPGYIIC